MSIGLANAIEALRSELSEAQQRAEAAKFNLPIESVTVELTVVATRDANGKIGFSVPLVGEVGVSATGSKSTTDRVSIVFGPPVNADGTDFRVSSDSPSPLR